MVNESCQASKQTDHEEIAALQDVNSKQTPKQRTPEACSASEPSTSEWGYDSEPTSQQDFVDPHLVKELLAMNKRANNLQQEINNLKQENEQMRQKIKKKELAKAAKRAEAESIKNC